MALKEIGPVIKKGNEGDDTPWGAIGSIAGGVLGGALGALAGPAGAMTGASAGMSVGGAVGQGSQQAFADKGTPDQMINPVKSTPLSTFAERSPDVAAAQLKKAMSALPESGLPMQEREAYQAMMSDAARRIKGMG